MDVLLGCHNQLKLPSGVIDFFGPTGSGKTTLALSAARQYFRHGLPALYIVTTNIPSIQDLDGCGFVGLPVALPKYGENVFDTAYEALDNGFKLVIIDSLTNAASVLSATAPLGEDHFSAANRRLQYHSLKALRSAARASDATVLCISEARDVLGRRLLRSALPDICLKLLHTQLFMQRIEWESAYGKFSRAVVEARQTYGDPTGAGARTFTILPDEGVSVGLELLNHFVNTGTLRRSGAYYRYKDHQPYGPGLEKAAAAIKEAFYAQED